MNRFNPLPRVTARRFANMNPQEPNPNPQPQAVNLQMLYDNMVLMERRLNNLQAENDGLRAVAQNNQQPAREAADDIFRIPDPIKSLPTFDGKKKQATAWVQTVRTTLDRFRNRVSEEIIEMYEQCVINKVIGEARDILCSNGNPQTFEEAARVLLNSFGDKNTIATYQTQIWNMKMENSLHNYYKKAKELMVNIKSLAKENQTYAAHWEAINLFIEQESLAAFINGLQKPYFGYAQTAQPEDIETAYAFLCRFQCAEITKKQTQPTNSSNYQKGQFQNSPSNHKPQGQKQNKFFSNTQPRSDRSKITPMEIDPSIRSKQGKIFNHDSDPVEETPEENQDELSDSESETETNFQIATEKRYPR